MKHIAIIHFVLLSLVCIAQPTAYNLPEGPYGGGMGYDGVVTSTSGYVIVNSWSSLEREIEVNKRTRVYINGEIEIGNDTIVIDTPNTIIAGNRGVSNINVSRLVRGIGGYLTNNKGVIRIAANNVRITGIEVIGKTKSFGSSEDVWENSAAGINVESFVTDAEIDNCLISNWTGSGIRVVGNNSNQDIRIHHNVFKDNNSLAWPSTGSLGYGISINGLDAMATIAYNLFENNKHAIAGSKEGGESYIAVYNVDVPNQWRLYDHSFDMHGYFDSEGADTLVCNYTDPCNYAGDEIIIENNFFEVGSIGQEAIQIRGIPKTTAIVADNYFGTSISNDDIVQKLNEDNVRYGRFFNISASNNQLNSNISYLYSSSEASNPWKLIAPFVWDENEVGVGDFDGDGIDDLFRSQSGKWYVSSRGSGNWEQRGTSGISASGLVFDDFNNDGRTDVLAAWSGKWHLASAKANGGFNGWVLIGNIGYGVNDVIVGDFNNDGWTDLMRTSNGKWYRSYNLNGTLTTWVQFGTSNYTINDFGTGDFDANGYTDLFINDGGVWKVVYRGASGWGTWQNVGISSYGPQDLKFGDYDGDGDTDLMRSDGSNWYISYSNGSSMSFTSWGSPVNSSNLPFAEFFVGDFDGDGRSDINAIIPRVNDFSATSRKSFDESSDGGEGTEVGGTNFIENSESVYPNPTTGIITLHKYSIDIPVLNQVMDGNGRVLFETSESTLNISEYPNGLYFIRSFRRTEIVIHKILKK